MYSIFLESVAFQTADLISAMRALMPVTASLTDSIGVTIA